MRNTYRLILGFCGMLRLADSEIPFKDTSVGSVVFRLVQMVRHWQVRVMTGKSFSGGSDGGMKTPRMPLHYPSLSTSTRNSSFGELLEPVQP